MINKKKVKAETVIKVQPSVIIGLVFYVVSSFLLAFFITSGEITELQAWILMLIGIVFVASQFYLPKFIKQRKNNNQKNTALENSKTKYPETPHQSFLEWLRELTIHGFMYAFLVFALIVFVRESLGATFDMAQATLFSVGGIIIMFTSYVSSFPELMLAFHFARANKQNALLGMLFGSNVIDLSFAGFRAMWLHEPIEVYTTGLFSSLLPLYIWALPVIALLSLLGLLSGKIKYKTAYPAVIFYVFYIISGFILL